MAKETECLEIVELIERHTATAHDPNVSGVNINWVVSGFLACTLNRLIYSALFFVVLYIIVKLTNLKNMPTVYLLVLAGSILESSGKLLGKSGSI